MCFGNMALSFLLVAGLSGEDEWSHNKGSSALSATFSPPVSFSGEMKNGSISFRLLKCDGGADR